MDWSEDGGGCDHERMCYSIAYSAFIYSYVYPALFIRVRILFIKRQIACIAG